MLRPFCLRLKSHAPHGLRWSEKSRPQFPMPISRSDVSLIFPCDPMERSLCQIVDAADFCVLEAVYRLTLHETACLHVQAATYDESYGCGEEDCRAISAN